MRKIQFEGPVTRSSAISVIDQLEKMDAASDEDIYIVINGPGGCCYAMLGVIDAMKRARSRVGTIVCGIAASANCEILACGEKGMRLAFPNAFIMCHEPRGGFDALDSASLERMEIIDELMKDHMKDMLNMSESELEEFVKRDRYMSAEEALEYGFIDAIVDGV